MSFDVFVWHPPNPISLEDIQAKYASADSEADANDLSSDRIASFRAVIEQKYPALESLSDDAADDSPWSASPVWTPRWMHAAIRWSAAQQVLDLLQDLAVGFGLALFDPQTSKVSGGTDAPVQHKLTFYDAPDIANPTPGVVREAVLGISRENWFVCLTRMQQIEAYAQVCLPSTEANSDSLAIEFRDGNRARHFGRRMSRQEAATALVDYMEEAPRFFTDPRWERIEF